VDPKVPQEDQFGVIRDMQSEGLIRHVGLSEATVTQIQAAHKFFPVATVQNRYNFTDRKSENVVDFCEANGIGFIPWFPLAKGDLTRPGSAFDRIAKKLDATPGQFYTRILSFFQPINFLPAFRERQAKQTVRNPAV
jgi:pyridoxine 4-dehydrogenase